MTLKIIIMNAFYFSTMIFLLMTSSMSYTQNTNSIDLYDAVKNNKIEVVNRKLTLINEEAHKGVRLSKEDGEGIAWLKGI